MDDRRDRVTPSGFRVSPLWLLGAAVSTLLLAGALFGTAWGRHQLAISFTRLPDSYVELYLAEPRQSATCPRPGSDRLVPFVVGNRSDGAVRIPWTATLRSVRPSAQPSAQPSPVASPLGSPLASPIGRGVAVVPPGGAVTATARYRVPVGGYTVEVTLVGRPERLLVTCPRPAGS